MDLGLISVRYARALLKAGIEAGVSDRVYNDMLTVLESYAKVPQLANKSRSHDYHSLLQTRFHRGGKQYSSS